MLVGWYSETAPHLLSLAKEMKLGFTLFQQEKSILRLSCGSPLHYCCFTPAPQYIYTGM